MKERSALFVAPADELLIVLDVRLHLREQMRLLLKYSIEDVIDQTAVLSLGCLVACTSRVQLSIELAIARVGVIKPVPLVRRENAEYDRENDQDPRKHVFKTERVPGEALPGESGRSPLIQIRGDVRRRRIGALR